MQLKTVPIDILSLDQENARVHPEKNLKAIQDSLTRFGQAIPLVIWQDVVIGGNGTLTAMKRLGLTEAQVVEFEGTKDQAKALAIALNRSAEHATWDNDQLAKTLIELSDLGYELQELGFNEEDLEDLFPEDAAEFRIAQPEITAEEPQKSNGQGTPIIQYALIFDNEDQQKRFFTFLRELKKEYPQEETNAARLDRVVTELLSG